jgi:hypothetical protein
LNFLWSLDEIYKNAVRYFSYDPGKFHGFPLLSQRATAFETAVSHKGELALDRPGSPHYITKLPVTVPQALIDKTQDQDLEGRNLIAVKYQSSVICGCESSEAILAT